MITAAVLTLIALPVLFLLHYIRLRSYQGIFLSAISFLWFASYLFANLGMTFTLAGFTMSTSTACYTLVFIATLIVYQTEGPAQTRNLILVSAASLVFLILLQAGISAAGVLSDGAMVKLFRPSYRSFAFSMTAAICGLFIAVTALQFLLNRLPPALRIFCIFAALFAALLADSLIFELRRGPERLPEALQAAMAVKVLLALPAALFTGIYLRLMAHLGLLTETGRRGSLDIFRRISDLKQDLEEANRKLNLYAQNLESQVEERTAEIREKQARMDMELEIAAEIQRSILPKPGNDFSPRIIYRPLRIVSGDLYSFRRISPDQYFVFIADISGHGVPSALVSAMCHMVMLKLDTAATAPAALLARIHEELLQVDSSHYLTACCLKIDTGRKTVLYSNAAHVEPLIIAPEGSVRRLEGTGSVIGMQMSHEITEKEVSFSAGSRFLLFSDCLPEHKNAKGEEFGDDRLTTFAAQNTGISDEEFLLRLEKHFSAFSAEPLRDDLTVLAFSF